MSGAPQNDDAERAWKAAPAREPRTATAVAGITGGGATIELHCINLDAAHERWRVMEASLEDCAGVRLVRFPALTDARGGWIGCLRSHLSCMLQRMRGAPLVFVLEDDNVFNAPATLGAELGALQAWLLGHLGEWDAFTGSARIGRLPRDCDSAARGFALLDRAARLFRTTVAYGSSFVVYNAALLPWAAAWLARLESGSGRFAGSRDTIDRILPASAARSLASHSSPRNAIVKALLTMEP